MAAIPLFLAINRSQHEKLCFILALPGLGWAFTGKVRANSKSTVLQLLEETHEAELEGVLEEQQGLLPGLRSPLSDVEGLLGSVAASVDPENLRPEPGYDFQAPGPDDSHGPCPALNLLANHGYLPQNCYVNLGEVVEAAA